MPSPPMLKARKGWFIWQWWKLQDRNLHDIWFFTITLPETNTAPEDRPSQKEISIATITFFQVRKILVSGRVYSNRVLLSLEKLSRKGSRIVFQESMAFRGLVLNFGSVSPFWRVKTKASYLSLMFFFHVGISSPMASNASPSGSFSSTTQPQTVAEVSANQRWWKWFHLARFLMDCSYPISIEQWKNPWLLRVYRGWQSYPVI